MLYPSREYRQRRRQLPGTLLCWVMAVIVAYVPILLQELVFLPALGAYGVLLTLLTFAAFMAVVFLASELQRQLDCPMQEGDDAV